ncbi:MAG: DUF2500 family protein [Ethanoligenens sp.]
MPLLHFDPIAMLPYLFILLLAVLLIWRALSEIFKRTVRTRAKVLEKYDTSYTTVGTMGLAKTVTDYVVVFDVAGRTKKFTVSIWLYESIKKGDEGMLQFKGDVLIRFQSHS